MGNTLLCVGLGNPGQQYLMTRHNIGFMAIDTVAQSYSFPSFKQKFKGEISDHKLHNNTVILLKPLTYMNLSGTSVQAAMTFYKLQPDHIIVFHDDLDLMPGQVKVKLGGGAGGHNGLKSIDQAIGNTYWRVRLGIGHPGLKHLVTNYVLSPFTNSEQEWLISLLQKIGENFIHLTTEKPEAWLKRLHENS